MTCIYIVQEDSDERWPMVVMFPRAEIRRVEINPLPDDERLDLDIEEDPDNERLFISVWSMGLQSNFDIEAWGMTDEGRQAMYEELAFNDVDADVTFTYAGGGRYERSEGRPERKLDRSYVKAVR